MLRNCLESNNIPIRKKWGQNFLIDKNIIKNIIKIINPSINDFIIEIGPGKGALTVPLSKKVKDIIAVEIDPLLMTATGRSDLFPLFSNSTELGRSKNRRVEFILEKEKKA